MGWFSNPDCPRCGRETSVDTDGLTNYYTCHPCNRKARQEKKDKEDTEQRLRDTEQKLKELEAILRSQNEKV